MNKITKHALVLGVAAMLTAQSVMATAIVGGFNSSSLYANDDDSSGQVSIGFTVDFFGNEYSQLYVNNNGNVTFDAPMYNYTPFNLYTAGRVIIAPFFGDVDTRPSGSDLTRWGTGTFGGHTAFGVTWDGVGVGYYSYGVDKLNKFQVLLVDRSDVGIGDFDIYFNYDQIQWETGAASGGSGGLGGSSARAGYSNGEMLNSYELPGSAVNGAFLDGGPDSLVAQSNIGQAGRYLFEVRNGTPLPPEPPTGVPDTGSSVQLLSLALAGLVGLARRANRKS